MKKYLVISTLLTALLGCVSAIARDDHKMYALEDALQKPATQGKLDPGVQLFFGDQKSPPIAKEHGEWSTNKKTNGFNKSDKEACEWVFLTAVLELQARARKEGGNAIVNIKSNYKNIETSSEKEFMCGSGAVMSGVALKGKVVKLNN